MYDMCEVLFAHLHCDYENVCASNGAILEQTYNDPFDLTILRTLI